MNNCKVCDGTKNVSDMTDGTKLYPLCDDCRPLVVTFFHIHGSMAVSISVAQLAKLGRIAP